MAHYVGRVLHIRPNTILDEWGVPELIVAYGQFRNEDAMRNYQEWAASQQKNKKPEKPKKYDVIFISPDQWGDLEDEQGGE